MIGSVVGVEMEPTAVSRAVPEWARLTWYGLLTVGGLIALAGVTHPRRQVSGLVTGLLWERRGVLGLVLGSALYGTALILLDGPVSKISGLITVTFAVACAARARDIGRDLARIQTLLRRP